MRTTLLRDVRGETGGSYLILVGVVGLVGLGAFGGLGGAFDTAIGSDSNGGVPAVVMAGMAGEAPATPPPSTQGGAGGGGGGGVTVVTVEAGTGEGGPSMWGDTNGDGVLSEEEARAAAASLPGGLSDTLKSKGGGGCSGFSLCHVSNAAKSVARNPIVRGIGNFANNMGLNPIQMLTDPIGYAKGTWNRAWGVGQFVWGTGKGLYTLVENGSELFNPLDPRFAYQLVTDPKGFVDRRVGVAKEAWRLAPGVLNMAWEMSPAGMVYDLATGGPDKFLADRKKYTEQLWENPLTKSLVQPWKDCAGEPSAAAQNACGQVAADIALTILTGGAGKGVRGASVVDDMARVASHGDDVARAASHADEIADAGKVTSKVDEVGDAARVGDEGATAADDLGRGDDLTDCANGVCRSKHNDQLDGLSTKELAALREQAIGKKVGKDHLEDLRTRHNEGLDPSDPAYIAKSGRENMAYADTDIAGVDDLGGGPYVTSSAHPQGGGDLPWNPNGSDLGETISRGTKKAPDGATNPRVYDTERVIGEDFLNKTSADAAGTLRIHTRMPACTSCADTVLPQVSRARPNVRILVSNSQNNTILVIENGVSRVLPVP